MIAGGIALDGPALLAALPATPGYHDHAWIYRHHRSVLARGRVSRGMFRFLHFVAELADTIDPTGDYTHGTAYLRVMPAEAVTAGRLHYDTGLPLPAAGHNAGQPVWRFTTAVASDNWPVQNAFTDWPELHGLDVAAAQAERPLHLYQPPNGLVVAFSEGEGLHGRVPAPGRPGHRVAFLSATLYTATQASNLDCPALAPLRGAPADRQLPVRDGA